MRKIWGIFLAAAVLLSGCKRYDPVETTETPPPVVVQEESTGSGALETEQETEGTAAPEPVEVWPPDGLSRLPWSVLQIPGQMDRQNRHSAYTAHGPEFAKYHVLSRKSEMLQYLSNLKTWPWSPLDFW